MANLQQIEHKSEASIIMYTFYGIEKYNKVREKHFKNLSLGTDYYKIIGDFFHSGHVVFGKLFLTETEVNEFISIINPTLICIKNEAFYFDILSDESLYTLRNIKLKAKHIGTNFENPKVRTEEDANEYLFLKI